MGEAERSAAGFAAHRGLLACAAGAAMAEAGLLVAVAPAARALAPQITALPMLAIFHDLRWLYSHPHPWLAFAAMLTGLVLGRSAVNAVLVRLAWPAGETPPRPAAAFRAALSLTLFASLLISPIVSLTFGVAILPFSWPFLASLPVMLVIAIPLSHGGVTGTWWRRLPPPGAMTWLLADFLLLSAAAAVIGWLPAAAAVPVAGLAGLANARAWHGLAASVARHGGPVLAQVAAHERRYPVALIATATAVALVIAVTRLAFLANATAVRAGVGSPVVTGQPDGRGERPGGGTGAGAQPGQRQPVLVVAGFGSHCCTADSSLARMLPDRLVQQFSYRGLSASGQPLPYGPVAGNLPLPVLGDRVAAQLWRLHSETGQAVDVVAESEGTLAVDAMLARHPDVPVGSIAMLSPIVAPGRVNYPVDEPGIVPGYELHAMIWFVGGLSPFGTAGAQTLISSVNSYGAEFASAAARHHQARWLELIPLADAVTLPACSLPPSVAVVPAFHGRLLGDPAALRMVRAFLGGQQVQGTALLRTAAELVAATTAAWRMPEPEVPSPPCSR